MIASFLQQMLLFFSQYNNERKNGFFKQTEHLQIMVKSGFNVTSDKSPLLIPNSLLLMDIYSPRGRFIQTTLHHTFIIYLISVHNSEINIC